MPIAARLAGRLPPLLRWSWLRCAMAFAAMACCSVAMAASIFIRDDRGMPRWEIPSRLFLLVQGALFGLLMVALLDHRLRVRRLKRTLDEGGGLACGHCGHSLRMVRNNGSCSECGKAFDVERLQGYWQRLFTPRGRRDPQPLRASRAPIGWLFVVAIIPIWGAARIPFNRRPRLAWHDDLEAWLFSNASIIPIMVFLWCLAFIQTRRGIARRAWRSNFAMCGWCGRPLQGTHDPISCRACGTKYDPVELRAAWLRDCPAHWRIEGQVL